MVLAVVEVVVAVGRNIEEDQALELELAYHLFALSVGQLVDLSQQLCGEQ